MARINDCAHDEVDEFSLSQWHPVEMTDVNGTCCLIPCKLARDVSIHIRATCLYSVDSRHIKIIRYCELNARVSPQGVLDLHAEGKGAWLVD